MDLSNLKKITTKSKKRIGRGHGSGRGGHTSTRGSKGQKARRSISLIFEGAKLKKSWIKRLPLLRGKGKFKSYNRDAYLVNLDQLSVFKDKDEVTIASLKQKAILPKDFKSSATVKILNKGELAVALTVKLPCSKAAAEKIKSSGGKVIMEKTK